ncbi:helix-turn-helix domain-containing protein [Enterobacter asburiae]|jgi:hypothetical protein|uniref:helix-turn-helix domain-containing protein n=1 Tax=Enterobacter asburiae TaxID=61645 RepID=UPI002CB7646B|nr:helix-turn-helix domain-containing protein [Enterobacter asburiae]
MKPEDDIRRLIEAASDPKRIRTARNRQLITFGQFSEPQTLVLHDGLVSFIRGQDQLLISTVKGPMIFGSNFRSPENLDAYFKSIGYSQYEIFPRSNLAEIVKQHGLWESLANVLMFTHSHLTDTYVNLVGLPTYTLICNQLYALMGEEDDVREEITACDYIQSKTLLSRSGVMKILSDLKKGGHIELKRGILMSINHLPTNY